LSYTVFVFSQTPTRVSITVQNARKLFIFLMADLHYTTYAQKCRVQPAYNLLHATVSGKSCEV
jgi:hypothetical protein